MTTDSVTTNSTTTDGMTTDMIERGIDKHPTCQCGRPMTAVVHGETMWVECSLLSQPVDGRFRRALAAMTAYLHDAESLGEVRAA